MTAKCLVVLTSILACLSASSVAMAGGLEIAIRDSYLAKLGADSTWSAAKEVKVPLLEVAIGQDLSCQRLIEGKEKPYRIDTPENVAKLGAAVEKNGCRIVAFCAPVHFPKDQDNTAAVAFVEKVARAAAQLKVPVVMTPLGSKGLDQSEFTDRAVDFVKKCAPIARATKVQLAVENLGPYLNKAEVLKPIMEATPDDEFGLALDITNMYWFGYPRSRLYELAATFAPHVRYVHAKNIKYPADKRNEPRPMGWEYGKYADFVRVGDIDFSWILDIYTEAGFQGTITLEGDGVGRYPADKLKKGIIEDSAYLRKIVAGKKKPVGSKVALETSMGTIVLELYPDKAPITVENFLRYVDEGYYTDTIFHRVMPNFMIQGGGFTSMNQRKDDGMHEPIQNEAKNGLKNARGTIAMARTNDPHSATSQFFINVADNTSLDHPSFDGWGYCVFGKVVEGMDVVDKIKSVPTRPNPGNPRERSAPVNPPKIIKAQRVK